MALKKKKTSKGATGNPEAEGSDRPMKESYNSRTRQAARVAKRVQEAYPMVGGNSGQDAQWRNISSNNSPRDLNPLTQDRMRDIAFYLYDSNPMGHRIIEIMTDFVVGDGFTYKAEDDDVQEVIDRFWMDNELDEQLFTDIAELSLFGELCLPVSVNKIDGSVTLGYLEPALIKSVVKNKKNPRFNAKVRWQKPRHGSTINVFDIIQRDTKPRSDTYNIRVGDCFYFTINKVHSATRGRSDLLALADWLDGHDQFLFARLERAFILNNFIWDITCEGMTKEELIEFVSTIGVLKPGSIRAHNDKIKWEAVNPKLESADASQEARLFKNQILGGAGFPEHWFAEGSKTTRATALEMGLPTLKRLRSRQKKIVFMLKHILDFVIDQAVLKGTLSEKVNKKYVLAPSPIVSRDNKAMAAAVKDFTEGMGAAVRNKWVTNQGAAKAFKLLLAQIGAEFDDISDESNVGEMPDIEKVEKVEPKGEEKDE